MDRNMIASLATEMAETCPVEVARAAGRKGWREEATEDGLIVPMRGFALSEDDLGRAKRLAVGLLLGLELEDLGY